MQPSALFDALPDAACRIDAHGAVVLANAAARAHIAEAAAPFASALAQLQRDGASGAVEYEVGAGAALRHYEARLSALPQGEAIVLVRDITARKQAELALRERDAQFQHLAGNITDVLWIRSPDMREVQYVSPGFERIWGRPMQTHYAAPGKWTDYIVEEDRERVASSFAELTRERPSLDIEYGIVRPDGERRWVRVRGFQVRDAAGRLIRITGIVTDLTERKRAQEELETARQAELQIAQLRASHGELEDLMHSLAHDVGAPLIALRSFSQLLAAELEGQIGGKARHYVERIEANSRLGTQMIEGLLGLDRVMRAPLRLEPLDLGQLAKAAADELKAAVAVQDGLLAQADSVLMQIALRHLVDNACKFRRPGATPLIEVGRQARPDGEPVFYVRDDGIGFDMAYRDKLFRTFQRLHGDSTLPGTGVGLVTVSRIVSRHGGRIWAESSPGRGATFYFTLPAASQAPANQVSPSR